ncbi:hypothetical protein C8E03_108115 [Lachnotalea glycerini]|uniref:Uncharacterized protein n=1 Tax=Lachnotalea glycerini TaxID=1763509 RepID=A0A318EM75_9FIRM|nr:hypothetical protein [Lachnotalea glycerini]OYP38088.1 hypothetical protein CG709_05635 [Lachnotalea glycerini]PXV88388.1 hypothetical protein C8E03_108115 [Lachnotalea glycerini]
MLDARIGDIVIMNNKYYVPKEKQGKEFEVVSEPWNLCGTMVVKLEGVRGGYAMDGLDLICRSESEGK